MHGCWANGSDRRSGTSPRSRLKAEFQPSPWRAIEAVQIALYGRVG
jgi:hypothetical protein